MKASRRSLEWRGVPALCAGVVGFAAYSAADEWTWALMAGAVAAVALLGCLLQNLTARAVALGLTAVLVGLPALYLLAMYAPFGVVLSVAPIFAAWGSIRAARGRTGVPHPLA